MNEQELGERLFKAIYEVLLHKDNDDLPSREVVRYAMGAVSRFAEREGVKMEYLIK